MSELDIQKDIQLEDKQEITEPPRYNIVLFNDDFTPMDFVVSILVDVVQVPFKKAYSIMMEVHNNGKAVAGSFSQEIAIAKASKIHSIATSEGHPMRCEVWPESGPSKTNKP